MAYLYRSLKIKESNNQILSIDELLVKCMALEQSLREKSLRSISQTAAVLLKKEIIFGYEQMTPRELNAHKSMYVAMDCIDLLMDTYEPDYEEACQVEMKKQWAVHNQSESINTFGNYLQCN